MTISTIPSTNRGTKRSRGFTLLEVIIGGTMGSIILLGVLTAFLMLGRSGANAANYSVMEAQSRRALEELSQDLRMSSGITWNSSTSITLLVPDNYTTTSNRVTYAYDSSGKTFYRMPGDASATNTKTTLISNVSTFAYSRYDRIDGVLDPAVISTANDNSTKRVQLSMIVRTTTRTVATASNNILSASFILRNKPVN